MEEGSHVWLRSPKSEWGWLPARIVKKTIIPRKNLKKVKADDNVETKNGNESNGDAADNGENDLRDEDDDGAVVELTLVDDFTGLGNEGQYYRRSANASNNSSVKEGIKKTLTKSSGYGRQLSGYYADVEPFTQVIIVDNVGSNADGFGVGEHPDIKLRNMPASSSSALLYGGTAGGNSLQQKSKKEHSNNLTIDTGSHNPNGMIAYPPTLIQESITGGVDDLIGLTHLHEPAILHALRLRYDADIIYTSTGPILLAINPFKSMKGVYGRGLMELYRMQGETKITGKGGVSNTTPNPTSPRNGPTTPVKGSLTSPSNIVDLNLLSSSTILLTDDGDPIPALYLHRPDGKLPPHVYQTADDAYRAMMHGIEIDKFVKRGGSSRSLRSVSSKKSLGDKSNGGIADQFEIPTNQSILVSGESGAGKTVTTKIVLNYFAMLSRKLQEAMLNNDNVEDSRSSNTADSVANGGIVSPRSLIMGYGTNGATRRSRQNSCGDESSSLSGKDASIEQQVLQSNPILEAFGNARTMRNDNSSRFGKYINIAFSEKGQLLRASIDTYLLEKVRLIHQAKGERNFHIFYQLLQAASEEEREDLFLNDFTAKDFNMTNQSETYDRRDGIKDADMHKEMVDAMQVMKFGSETVRQLMRLIVAVLFAGNMTFTTNKSSSGVDSCALEETEASLAVAHLLGVSFDNLAASLTSKVIFVSGDIIHKGLDVGQAEKANEALIKSIYGAAFDFIAERINASICAGRGGVMNGSSDGSKGSSLLRRGVSEREQSIIPPGGASIGVLDIFGFETFETNNFEQLCINYTNETLQQQFNKFVFKMEQQEYEREGILWKFIPFPDNQDVLDLIAKPRSGILQILDEQCIVDWGTDRKFGLSLYQNCTKHNRFSVTSSQRVNNKFSIEHYAGYVEYTAENWLEKNKDQLPAASVELLESSDFELIGQIKKYVRSEGSKITTKSLGKQFSDSLKILRARIDSTMPHYVRCLKPNDDLAPDTFDPKNIVEQLRYCGVLEAVRVSRAGYPTRYPHDVFYSRYFPLCPDRSRDSGNLSPYHDESTDNLSEDQKQLKRLVSRVAAEVWQLEHDVHLRRLEAERRRLGTNTTVQQQPKETNIRNALARPETIDEFMRLDFSSRCAVAGLQLGKSKVFLRREAFESIEAIRNGKFGANVTKIAKYWRRYLARRYFIHVCRCAVKIQCLIRSSQAKEKTNELMKEFKQYLLMKEASRKILRSYRNHIAWNNEGADLRQKKAAVKTIQSIIRGHLARKEVAGIVKCVVKFQALWHAMQTRRKYEETITAVIRIQSVGRMVLAFHRKEEAIRERSATKIQSTVRMTVVLIEFRKKKQAVNIIKRSYRQHLYPIKLFFGTFSKRYYMLIDSDEIQPTRKKHDKRKRIILARHRNAIINEKRLELAKLVSKLTLALWEPSLFESFSKAAHKAAPQAAPLSEITLIPRTRAEFLSRDTPSMYALVGLQLYQGMVFLRPETYDRLETMRNEVVSGSSTKIQSAARRKLAVTEMKRKKTATVKLQSVFRMRFARKKLVPMRQEHAATLIQSIFRMSTTKKRVWDQYWSTQTSELFGYIDENNWYMVEEMLHKNPLLTEELDPSTGELLLHKIAEHPSAWSLLIDMILTLYPKAVVHRDMSGALPIHHAAKADNLTALEIVYDSYKNGARDVDATGRLPIHVAAEHGSIEAIKYLTMKAPHGVGAAVLPGSEVGGTIALHLACKFYSSVGAISSLLRTHSNNFSLASRLDENGELPLHLLLRCGARVDVAAVKTLLTCYPNAIATRDKLAGDIPLHIALKHGCSVTVIGTLIAHFPGACVVMDGEGHSPLFLALSNSSNDATSLSLINHSPELVTLIDDDTGKLPIQIAIENDLSLSIVYRLLTKDLPIDLDEKVHVKLIPHHYSWNYILREDRYYRVVSRILQHCVQPQVLALAHVEDQNGNISLSSAAPLCRHEIRVMLRLFNTLELVKQRPSFCNPISETEIFYALRYDPPPEQDDLFVTDYENKETEHDDFLDDWDDDLSRISLSCIDKEKTRDRDDVNLSPSEKLKMIRKEKGQHVIAKITPRSDIVSRELRVRKYHNLSRHYVPSVISVHHTVHHGAYANASAEPAYCVTIEGADATFEHQMLDLRRAGKAFPANELKRIAISLLHLHENGLVHTDFGPHNVGKFGPLWKLLGVGGSVRIGEPTEPNHGIYHPPEAIAIESVIIDGKQKKTARVRSIPAALSHDIWSFGTMVYEAVVGAPLSAYSHRGHRVKSSNLAKIGRWDDNSLKRALRHIDEEDTLARDVLHKLLHPDSSKRYSSIRDVIEEPFFTVDSGDRKIQRKEKEVMIPKES